MSSSSVQLSVVFRGIHADVRIGPEGVILLDFKDHMPCFMVTDDVAVDGARALLHSIEKGMHTIVEHYT